MGYNGLILWKIAINCNLTYIIMQNLLTEASFHYMINTKKYGAAALSCENCVFNIGANECVKAKNCREVSLCNSREI